MMRVIGPSFGGVYKINYKDVSGREDEFIYRKEESSSLDAIKDVFEGREDDAALVKAFDPKDRQMHTYAVTNDAKGKTLDRVKSLSRQPTGKAFVLTGPSDPSLPQVHRYALSTIRYIDPAEVPTVDFEYAYRSPTNKDAFFQQVGLDN